MHAFTKKTLRIVLDALGSVGMVITAGMLAILVGAAGVLLGFIYAKQHDFSDSARYAVEALCALVAPVLLGVWLWRRVIKPDDDPRQSS